MSNQQQQAPQPWTNKTLQERQQLWITPDGAYQLLAHYTEDVRKSYKNGLEKLYKDYEIYKSQDPQNTNPEVRRKRQAAHDKLTEVSLKIRAQLSQPNQNEKAAAAAQETQPQGDTRPGNQVQSNQANASVVAAQQRLTQLNEAVQKKVKGIHIFPPPDLQPSSEEATKWINNERSSLGRALLTMENLKERLRRIKEVRAAREASGKPLTKDEESVAKAQEASYDKEIRTSRLWLEAFQTKQKAWKDQNDKKQLNGQQTGNGMANSQASPDQQSSNLASHGDNSLRPSIAQDSPVQAPSSVKAAQPENPSATQDTRQSYSYSAAIDAAAQSHEKSAAQAPGSAAAGYSNSHQLPTAQPQPSIGSRGEIATTKMPIPKTLTPQQPKAVSMGNSRPTYSAGVGNGAHGMMGQPAFQTQPSYTLEGEGERVLSKKKLDELVRQVTGGNETLGGDGLTPEVEEAILEAADDFVDQVVMAACRIAKLRNSSTLEVRDVQLILERQYNIRIPGYSSDEIRTVKKMAPAVGWTQKMSAIQAAKVSKDKGDS